MDQLKFKLQQFSSAKAKVLNYLYFHGFYPGLMRPKTLPLKTYSKNDMVSNYHHWQEIQEISFQSAHYLLMLSHINPPKRWKLNPKAQCLADLWRYSLYIRGTSEIQVRNLGIGQLDGGSGVGSPLPSKKSDAESAPCSPEPENIELAPATHIHVTQIRFQCSSLVSIQERKAIDYLK